MLFRRPWLCIKDSRPFGFSTPFDFSLRLVFSPIAFLAMIALLASRLKLDDVTLVAAS